MRDSWRCFWRLRVADDLTGFAKGKVKLLVAESEDK